MKFNLFLLNEINFFDDFIFSIFFFFFIFIIQLIIIAFFTLYERKFMASIQKRLGPNFSGFFGILQPIADGIKLLFKETIFPKNSQKGLFIFSSVYIFSISILLLCFIPFNISSSFSSSEFSLLFFIGFSSMNVIGLLFAGWSSQNKYAMIGSLRACSQMISYELIFSICILNIILFSQSTNLYSIVISQINYFWYIWLMFPLGILFFIILLAETNRAPFDLPEAESELIAGYNLEYSSLIFAFFFLGEYSNILSMSALYICLFFGGWSLPFCSLSLNLKIPLLIQSFIFSFKIIFIVSLFILIRACFPRFRYDQLITLCWKNLLPFILIYYIFSINFFYFFFIIF